MSNYDTRARATALMPGGGGGEVDRQGTPHTQHYHCRHCRNTIHTGCDPPPRAGHPDVARASLCPICPLGRTSWQGRAVTHNRSGCVGFDIRSSKSFHHKPSRHLWGRLKGSARGNFTCLTLHYPNPRPPWSTCASVQGQQRQGTGACVCQHIRSDRGQGAGDKGRRSRVVRATGAAKIITVWAPAPVLAAASVATIKIDILCFDFLISE